MIESWHLNQWWYLPTSTVHPYPFLKEQLKHQKPPIKSACEDYEAAAKEYRSHGFSKGCLRLFS